MHWNQIGAATNASSSGCAFVRCHDVHRDASEKGNITRAVATSVSDLPRNRLLAALPPEELEWVRPYLTPR